MRTTLNIDDDVLMVIKQIADRQHISRGKVVSHLARQALLSQESGGTRNGIPLFPRRADGKVVTLELVNQLRDELP
jgi:predicted urease superfamily metal-dependent hydrolase